MAEKWVYFDMDGTIADLYGVCNWLSYLENESVFPYTNAANLVERNAFAERVNLLRAHGYKIGIISWLSKSGSAEYKEAIKMAKLFWLAVHFRGVKFDEIHIVDYGTPKSEVVENPGWLFDDEEKNRAEWGGLALDVNNILKDMELIATL